MRNSVVLAGSVFLSLVFAGVLAVGCGGSDVPEAPPGVPMTPPTEDPALAEMMAAGSDTHTAAPHPTVSAAPPPAPTTSAVAAPSGSAAPKKPPPPAASAAPAKKP